MALSWNEIKDRALKFTKEWEGESRERAEKDSFWNDFFNVFGISRRRLATFEEPVKKLNNKQGFIDLFWKGTLLVEHKSKGKNLEAAFEQATDYFHGIKEHELPKYVLVSDFENFKLYDLDDNKEHEFEIKDFHKNIKLFGFIAGYQKRTFKNEDPVNIKAAELMGKLHDQLEESGYEGHPLEVFLVRLLFCLFADDTGIFEKDTFKELIEVKTNEDGSDLGAWLAQYFQILNTPTDKRLKNLDEHLAAFPYVNGKLFEEPLPIASFNSKMREILLECSSLDWGKISPAIFGSMFQSVMNPKERRNLGAHYTSEKNILKLIKPLFLDELQAEFEKVKNNKSKLKEFHQKLGSLKFLDPACGCGNFLIITYRELRLLEIEVVKIRFKFEGIQFGKSGYAQVKIDQFVKVDVDQFYGIEYDEFPARIAEVALWLMDHQMNLLVSEAFGMYYARLPLRKSATIIHGNALRMDWNSITNKNDLNVHANVTNVYQLKEPQPHYNTLNVYSNKVNVHKEHAAIDTKWASHSYGKADYILGNPPFVGHQWRSKAQKEDMDIVFGKNSTTRRLDYVAAWYYKAAEYAQNTFVEIGFVSTNSVCQGEQVPILWRKLFNQFKMTINYAHQTFEWGNEAKANAKVHVVIVGYSSKNPKTKLLFEYDDIRKDPVVKEVKNINGYLVAGPNIFIESRGKPIHNKPGVFKGSQPTDGGNLIFNQEAYEDFIKREPNSIKWIRQYIGGAELMRGTKRYCLWLKDCPPQEIKRMPLVIERLRLVSEARLKSSTKSVREFSKFPSLFTQDRQPESDYLAMPRVSSGRREYIPIAYLSSNVIAHEKLIIIPNASLYLFGVLMSSMHNLWTKKFSGRLKSDISYSPAVYNNYPWPKEPSDKNKKAVETKAQKVLDVRAEFQESSLADLYDPLTMPPKLVKAHQELDKAVDLCYRPQAFPNETTRIEFLSDLYNQYTESLLKPKKS